MPKAVGLNDPHPLLGNAPELYRLVLTYRWSHVIQRAKSHPEEARYWNPNDGRTALHLAVLHRMSSGGSQATAHRSSMAFGGKGPVDAIRALLVACPDAACQRDKIMGFTPLTYGCLLPPPDRRRNRQNAYQQHTLEDEMSVSTRGSVYQSVYQKSLSVLDDAEEVVRTILEQRRDAASVLTRDGMSPLDVHVASYSRGWGSIEDEGTEGFGGMGSGGGGGGGGGGAGLGRTTTGVLRALLEADPTLARPRKIYNDENSMGPLELLYHHNAAAFLTALEREEEHVRQHDGRTMKAWFDAPETRPTNNNSNTNPSKNVSLSKSKSRLARSTKTISSSAGAGKKTNRTPATSSLSSWWAWKWSIMLLKYGEVSRRKRGGRFRAVHAAAGAEGCPLPIIMLAIRAFPNQVREFDGTDSDSNGGGGGDLPLHIVAGWSSQGLGGDRRGAALCALLTEYPEAAEIKNKDGRTALVLALERGASWERGGIRRLVRAFPDAVAERDEKTGLLPFMIAASQRSSGPSKGVGILGRLSQRSAELHGVRTAFELLRYNPDVMKEYTEEDHWSGKWADFQPNNSKSDSGGSSSTDSAPTEKRNGEKQPKTTRKGDFGDSWVSFQ